VYDIKDHGYAKFRLGHVFVRMESAQVCDVALTYTPQPIKKVKESGFVVLLLLHLTFKALS